MTGEKQFVSRKSIKDQHIKKGISTGCLQTQTNSTIG